MDVLVVGCELQLWKKPDILLPGSENVKMSKTAGGSLKFSTKSLFPWYLVSFCTMLKFVLEEAAIGRKCLSH